MINFIPPFKIEKTSCGTIMQFKETIVIRGKGGEISHVLHYYKTIKSNIDSKIESPYTEKEINDYISKGIFKEIDD